MEPELYSQAGMEKSCRAFTKRLSSERDSRGPSYSCAIQPTFESCDFEKKVLTVSVRVEDFMRNTNNVMHGGAVATVMDTAMGSLTFYMCGEHLTPTINMNVSYERPIPLGEKLFVESTCLSCGKTMAYATARAYLEGKPEKIVASAAGTYYTAT